MLAFNKFGFQKRSMRVLASLLSGLVTFFAISGFAGTAQAQEKVVYHIDNTENQATKGLRNIRNHLDVAPESKITVVAHAEGVDFLMDGARDKKNPNVDYGALVSALKARGVKFEVCEITLTNRGLKKDQFILDVDYTPSGVVRIARLQAKEAHAYIKP